MIHTPEMGPLRWKESRVEDCTFHVGAITEGIPWRIKRNAETTEDSLMCKHCTPLEPKTITRPDGSTFTQMRGRVGRVVVAKNEGGNNVTEICLDCILEQADCEGYEE